MEGLLPDNIEPVPEGTAAQCCQCQVSRHELYVYRERSLITQRPYTVSGCLRLDDGMHMVYKCPAMQMVCEQFSRLFSGSTNMREFSPQADQVAVTVIKFV